MPTIALTFLLCLVGQALPAPHVRIDLVFKGRPMSPQLMENVLAETSAIWAAYRRLPGPDLEA